MTRRLVLIVVALASVWLGLATAGPVFAAPTTPDQTYTCMGHHHPATATTAACEAPTAAR